MSTVFSLFILELKSKWKSILIWSGVWIFMGLVMALVFQPMKEKIDQKMMEQMLKSFDQGLLDSFNIQSDYLEKVESFLAGEFLTFLTLAGSLFGASLGVNILAGKIYDKTIFLVLTKKISRVWIYITKFLVNTAFLFVSTLIMGLGVYISFALATKDDFSVKFFVSAFAGAFLLQWFFTSFGQAIGIILDKSRGQMMALGFAGLTWFLNSLSSISGFPKWVKPLSPFYYFNMKELTSSYNLDWSRAWVLIAFSLVFVVVGVWWFRRKDVQV